MNQVVRDARIELPALDDIGAGFASPVVGMQQVFRAVLQAMARPGRIERLAGSSLEGIEPPGIGPGASALLLTLLDADTRLHLPARRDQHPLANYLRFHTGVRLADEPAQADFLFGTAAQVGAQTWAAMNSGSDVAPQAGATLIVEVSALASIDACAIEPGGHGADSTRRSDSSSRADHADTVRLQLRGPGVRETASVAITGLPASFWHARVGRERDFPRGVDLILTCGDRLAALPRTTRIVLES